MLETIVDLLTEMDESDIPNLVASVSMKLFKAYIDKGFTTEQAMQLLVAATGRK